MPGVVRVGAWLTVTTVRGLMRFRSPDALCTSTPVSSVADLPRNRGDFLGAAADAQISSVMARGWSSGALGERPVGHRVDKTAHLAPVWDERIRRDPRQRLSHICRRVAK